MVPGQLQHRLWGHRCTQGGRVSSLKLSTSKCHCCSGHAQGLPRHWHDMAGYMLL